MPCRAIPTAAFALLAAPLLAAGPAPAGPKAEESVPPAAGRLLQYHKVQKELKMTAEQRVAVIDGLENTHDEFERRYDTLVKMPNVSIKAIEKLEADFDKARVKVLTAAAEKLLSGAQRARLRQLVWQVRGPDAFADPGVQTALGLSDAEKKAAAELAGRLKEKADKYLDGVVDGNTDKRKAELFAFRKETAKKFLDGLTAEQRSTWKALLGDPAQGLKPDELWLKSARDGEDEK